MATLTNAETGKFFSGEKMTPLFVREAGDCGGECLVCSQDPLILPIGTGTVDELAVKPKKRKQRAVQPAKWTKQPKYPGQRVFNRFNGLQVPFAGSKSPSKSKSYRPLASNSTFKVSPGYGNRAVSGFLTYQEPGQNELTLNASDQSHDFHSVENHNGYRVQGSEYCEYPFRTNGKNVPGQDIFATGCPGLAVGLPEHNPGDFPQSGDQDGVPGYIDTSDESPTDFIDSTNGYDQPFIRPGDPNLGYYGPISAWSEPNLDFDNENMWIDSSQGTEHGAPSRNQDFWLFYPPHLNQRTDIRRVEADTAREISQNQVPFPPTMLFFPFRPEHLSLSNTTQSCCRAYLNTSPYPSPGSNSITDTPSSTQYTSSPSPMCFSNIMPP